MANRTVLVKLVAETSQFTAGLSKASAATMRLGEQAGATGKKSKDSFDLAGKGALVMGGLAVAGLGMAISKASEFESSMSAVEAATHASVGTLGDLRAAAMKAGADTAYSAKEAADGITEMAKAGVSAKDIMGGGLKGALSLAAAGQIDVADAAGIASVAMTQFSLTGKDLPHVADLLAAGAGKAMGSVDDLGQALNQAGLVAAGAGFSIEETTGTLSAFAAAGLIGSDSGTSLKTAIQALQAPSSKAAQVMSDLGLNMYDSNGNMLSMAGIAGQLQDKLGGLTQEQRNSALATIFGSDAVRAANVLYSEGAAGIRDWTAKVNDSGYAADTAAKLQDNLSGDLEKLGGSFDTLMINLGSGSQGPLREIVQMFTGVLNAASDLVTVFASIPTPVLVAVGAMAAVAALKGPVGDAFDTISLKAMYAAESMGTAGLKGAASGLLGLLGGPAGLGILAVVGSFELLSSMTERNREVTSHAADAQVGLADALRQSKGALDDNVRSAAAKSLQDAQLLDIGERAGVSLSTMTDAILGNKDAYNQVSGALQDYANNRLIASGYESDGSTKLHDQAAAAGQAVKDFDTLSGTMAQTASQQQQLAAATDTTSSSIAAAVDPAKAFQDGLEGVATAASDSKKQIDLYKTSLDILNGAHITALQAESDFYSAIAASDGALKNLTGSTLNAAGGLDVQSEAGRKTFDVLSGVRSAADQYIATLIEQGATADEANAKDAELRDSFYQTALQMTGNADAAGRLTDEIYGIPSERATTITADTGPALTAINDLVNRSWVTHIGVKSDYSTPSLRGGTGLATGGYTGPGGKYEPAPYQVHRGEIVFSQADIAAHGGVSAVESMRRSRPAGYADGGVVGGINTIVTAQADAGSLEQAANALQTAADNLAPTAGSGGGMSGTWTSIAGIVQAAFPQARINSTYRPGDPGYHGKNKAVDFGFGSGPGGDGSAGLASIARFLYSGYGRSLAEIIYDGIGDNTPDVKNGQDHVYDAATRAEHHNHVHAAVYDQGGILPHGGVGVNLSGSPERVLNPSETRAYNSREFSGSSGSGGGGAVSVAPPVVKVFLDGQEWRGIARVEAEGVVVDALTGATTRARNNGA